MGEMEQLRKEADSLKDQITVSRLILSFVMSQETDMIIHNIIQLLIMTWLQFDHTQNIYNS